MDKKVLLVIAVLMLGIGGSIMYLLNSSADKTSVEKIATQAKQQMSQDPAIQPETTTPAETDSTYTPPVTTTEQPGIYEDYSADVIAETAGTKLLFFHASWCPQCRALEADIKQKGVPSGVAIIKVDYDTNQNLRQKYGVTLQTTLVRVDDQGNFVQKYVSYDEPTLNAVKRNLL